MIDRDDIKNLEIQNYDEDEIERYESKMDLDENALKERKESITCKISIENMDMCNEKVENQLKEGEKLIYKFKGIMSGWTYYAAINSYRFLTYGIGPLQLSNVGVNYLVYVTNKRMFILEVDGYYEIMKEYVFEFSDITKFNHKKKKGYMVFDFHHKDLKNDESDKYIVGTLNWAFIFNNRIIMKVNQSNIEEIVKFLDEKISNASSKIV